jgi:hypothetical protein
MKQSSSQLVDTIYKSRKIESKKCLLLRIQPHGRRFLFVCPEEAEAKGAEDFNTLVEGIFERLEDDDDGDVWWNMPSECGIYTKLRKKLEEEDDPSKRKELLQQLIALAESQLIEHTVTEAEKLLAATAKKEEEDGADDYKPYDIREHYMSANFPLEYILVDCASETHVNITNKCVACWMNTFGVRMLKASLEIVKRTGEWDNMDCYR